MPGVVEETEVGNHQDSIYSVNDTCCHIAPTSLSDNMKGGQRSHYSNGYNSDQQNDTSDDNPRYLLEHLATFSVGPQFGLASPKDGLRRLLQMEKSNGIWTQKMQMKLEKEWVIILDYDDGDIVERFPMSLISDPTAYTSDDPRELYNNILVFIVMEDSKNKSPNPSEMHIFQCARVYAQDVVDEMKMFMSGKTKTKYHENPRHLPPPPHNPPPEPPVNGNSSKVREHVAMFSSSAPPCTPKDVTHHQQRLDRSAVYTRESNDETSSTTSEKYEREVTILNHCFDDIERFVVRLQHAAAAYKELERRQKSRKNKKKDMGDGMLSIRAKPPPEREFVDILQKFKLSFNLLAKLKSHIHDPNAPELVHFLFTPLALIVDAARDANHSANVAARVVSPLLTRDAIELLTNCCTSKETDLWHSLGDSWIIPRDQWKGYEGSYHPVFSNGWAPENPIEDHSSVGNRTQRPENELREQDYHRVFSQPERESHYSSECFGSDRGEYQERTESPAGVPDHTHFRPPYERQYNHRTSDLRRDILDRGSMLSPESDFHDPRDRDVRSEFSSDSIEHGDVSSNPQRMFDRQQMQWLEELKSRRTKIVQVVYPRTANNDKELTVIRGEILEILDDSRKWWKARNMRGQVAHVPHTIVTPYPSVDDDVFNNPLYATRSSRDSYYSTGESAGKEQYVEDGSRSQDVPRSPPAQANPADWIRRERQGLKKHLLAIDLEAQSSSSTSPFPSPPPFRMPLPNRSGRVVNSDFERPPSSSEPRLSMVQNARETGHTDYTNIDRGSHEISDEDTIERQNIPCPAQETPIGEIETSQTQNLVPISEKPPIGRTIQPVTEEGSFELLQEELKATVGQQKGKKIWKKTSCLEHDKTECFYISQRSKKDEISHWLELKGFSKRTRHSLMECTGEVLFKYRKDQLEKYLGEEGLRLYSNLIVQKTFSGFATLSSEELTNILKKRREKVEIKS